MRLVELANSPIMMKILFFFHENPFAVDTARSIAAWTKQDPKLVKRALEELVEMNVLSAHRSISTTGYAYTQDAGITSTIAKLLKKASSRSRKR